MSTSSMLATLQRIIQEVNAAPGLTEVMSLIVHRVTDAMRCNVCSLYLADADRGQFVLVATVGLNAEAVGKVRINRRQGLVGLVAEREEPINLDSATEHPRFLYFPETGEERYQAFLGVPIIHYRKVMGVLVVQQHDRRRFDEQEVAFLMTVAAQLSGAIAHGEASGSINHLADDATSMRRGLQGIAGSPGVAMGVAVAVFNDADLATIPDRIPDDVDTEQAMFIAAVDAVYSETLALTKRSDIALPVEERGLFDAYARMLRSSSLLEGVLDRIKGGMWAPAAVRDTINEQARVFEQMDDPYLRERADDIRAMGRRIVQQLHDEANVVREYPERTILVGEEITATQLMEVPRDNLFGVVSARGSSTSHTAILARALGVPAVMGVSDMTVSRLDGRDLIIDGYSGRVFVDPDKLIRDEYARLLREDTELTEGLKNLIDQPAETLDGYKVGLYANTGLLSDVTASLDSGCDGVGLHRTEFPFIIRDRFPGEDEQTDLYLKVLQPFAPRPVTLRTLDIGGDKSLPYFPVREDNPFLGWRGIRVTLDHPEIFLTQIRAMLRANASTGNLQLLLPMISQVAEVDESLGLVTRAYRELLEEGTPAIMPKLGAMIEVPSAVYQAEAIARRVDFLSIGSNDLAQYLLAVDRNNSRVAHLYDELHPAVLRASKQVVDAGHRYRRPVSVCGAMASDPAAAIILVAMGIDILSMSAASLNRVKWVIRSFSKQYAEALLTEVMQLENAQAVRGVLHRALEQAGLGVLVRTQSR
jgi:phosphotransferase system, enzyme I, PtsP